jgi:hypothetical protein
MIIAVMQQRHYARFRATQRALAAPLCMTVASNNEYFSRQEVKRERQSHDEECQRGIIADFYRYFRRKIDDSSTVTNTLLDFGTWQGIGD